LVDGVKVGEHTPPAGGFGRRAQNRFGRDARTGTRAARAPEKREKQGFLKDFGVPE
jgi:hypothetical protein